jgi:3-hydroxypropanoate dehydrogenase
MNRALDNAAFEQTFLNARTFNKFTQEDIPDALIIRLYDLMKWGPTAMNCQSAHFVIVKSQEAKMRLAPALLPGNRDKSLAAPATVIVATDTRFHENLPSQFPSKPNAGSMYESNAELRQVTALRNSSLQGAYFILAARMLGLDCGPMSGFDNQAVDAEFFPDGRYQSNFLVNIGFGDSSGNHPRGPRLPFGRAVEIL